MVASSRRKTPGRGQHLHARVKMGIRTASYRSDNYGGSEYGVFLAVVAENS